MSQLLRSANSRLIKTDPAARETRFWKSINLNPYKIPFEGRYHGEEGEETGDGADDEAAVHERVTLRVSVSVYHDPLYRVVQRVLNRASVPLVHLKRRGRKKEYRYPPIKRCWGNFEPYPILPMALAKGMARMG